MNKKDLIDVVTKKTKLTKKHVSEVINTTLDVISGNLKKVGDSFLAVGFGTFKVVQRKAKTIKNIQTGEPLRILAKKAVKFIPGKALKEKVAGKTKAKKKKNVGKKTKPGKKK